MMEAATEGLQKGASGKAGILAVTVLTSLGPEDVERFAPGMTPGKMVSKLAKAAAGAGVEGVVCGVPELGVVAEVAPDLVKVTPGIRPADPDASGGPDDQRRTATPAEAITRGSDYLVVGRAITAADDPVAAAIAINDEVASVE